MNSRELPPPPTLNGVPMGAGPGHECHVHLYPKPITIGSKVTYTGDRYGHNGAMTIDENVGKKGVISASHSTGFWWIKLDDKSEILAFETEIKLNEAP